MGKNSNDSTLQPTAWRRVLSNGVYVPATGGQAWLYRSVDPMPMVDVDEDLRNLGSQQLDRLFAELTESVTAQASRAVARTKGSYPRFHILATRIWKPYEPPAGSQMSPQLRRWYRDRLVPHLAVAVGLPLDNGVDLDGLSFVQRQMKRINFLIRGADGASELNWAESLVAQERVAGNARLGRLSAHDMDAIGAWWNDGRWRDCSTLPHADHLHVVHDPAVAARLSKLDESGVDCSTWTDFVPTGHSALTIAAVPHLSAANEHGAPVPTWWDGASLEALWGHWLFAAGAKAISIRGVLEPSAATLKAVQDEQRRIEAMQQKRAEANKDQAAWLAQRAGATAEMEERLLEIGVGPTTMDCRITVAFEGVVSGDQEWKALSSSARVPLVPISYAQPLAMFEMQPTATVSANPNICDPSARTVSHAGLNARPQLGDPDGAIFGWRDGYPVYLNPFASVDNDSGSVTVGCGQVGSGKTFALLKLATQFPALGCPAVVVDLKTESDLSEPVVACGGKVHNLSSALEQEGAFDPFGFAPVEARAALATMFITSCAIFGDLKVIDNRSIEVVLEGALSYGVEQGCRSTMQALESAHAAGRLPDQVLSMVKDAHAASAMFRAGCSARPAETSMRDFEGLTLIQVGATYLDLPKPSEPVANWTGQQARCVAVLRMLVLAAAYALAHRGGALIIDEAWVLLSHPSGAEQIDRAARLGRSWRTPIFLFTQNPSDIIRSGIERYTTRWIGLALDRNEVPIMANWMQVDPESRVDEWSAPEGSEFGMRKVVDQTTNRVVRGSLCWFRDSKGRVGLVEIDAPGDMARLFSTNAKANAERAALSAG